MFEIKIADIDVTSGAVPVSWCITPELLKELADSSIADPQIIIVVAPAGKAYHESRETRYVVPLRDLLTYVEFRTPGPTKIWAFIPAQGTRSGLKDRYLSRSGGSYISNILSSDGDRWGYQFDETGATIKDINGWECMERAPHLSAPPLSLDVPKGIFAAEPSDAEKEWVNLVFTAKAVDQCDFRRRRMFAYTVQPFIVLVGILSRLVIYVLALLIGAKNATITHVMHPLTYSIESIFDVLGGGSIFIRHLPEDDDKGDLNGVQEFFSYTIRKYCFVPFMPLIILAFGLLAAVSSKFALMVILSIVFVLVFALFVLGMITGTANRFTDSIRSIVNRFRGKEDQSDDYWYMDPVEFEQAICSENQGARTFESLPANKKTLKLRYHNIKSKVCRPFSN